MINLLRSLLVVGLLGFVVALGTAFYSAPASFEGTITMKMTLDTGMEMPPEAAAMMANMMPSSMEIGFLGTKTFSRVLLGNGTAMSHTITDNATGQVYVINHKQRKILQYADTIGQNSTDGRPTFTTTTETRTILGYTCKKSIMTFTAEGKTTTLNMWGTNSIMPAMPSTQRRQYDPYIAAFTNGQVGFPLLMEAAIPEMPNSKMTIEATNVSNTAPAATLLELPAGYTTTVARNQQEINNYYRQAAMGGMGGR